MSSRRAEPLAAIYAGALAEVAHARGGDSLLLEVGDALSALGQAWRKDASLRAFLLSTLVPRSKKRAALGRLLEGFPPLLVDFVHLLLRRGRGALVDRVAVAYEAHLDRHLGRVPVTLVTATPVPPERLEAWVARIGAASGRTPVLHHVVREEILAGAILRVGDTVADGSARRALAEFQKHVREEGKRHALQA